MSEQNRSDFQEELRRRARELAPSALNLVQSIAEGTPPGATYRTRPSTQLSAVRLLLQIAGVQGVDPVTVQDLDRVQSLEDIDGQEHIDAETLEQTLRQHVPLLADVARCLDVTHDELVDMADLDFERTINAVTALKPYVENPESLPDGFFQMGRDQRLNLIMTIARKLAKKTAVAS